MRLDVFRVFEPRGNLLEVIWCHKTKTSGSHERKERKRFARFAIRSKVIGVELNQRLYLDSTWLFSPVYGGNTTNKLVLR